MNVETLDRGPITVDVALEPIDNRRLANFCGPFDQNIRQLEDAFGVRIHNRGHNFRIDGREESTRKVAALMTSLYEAAGEEELSTEKVHLHLQDSGVESLIHEQSEPGEAVRTRHGLVRTRGPNQARYVRAVMTHDINFGVGPAGTGKTYLAVACAIDALESDMVRRLVLVRPAVEAGERLGFLPGDLAQKVDPYLRPLFDALYEMLGFERVGKLIERSVIEIAPLAYMRGRTLNESFIILDEAQNTTIEQMKMFLTRIGFGSTAVITGDVTQIDLPRGQRSGLVHARRVLAEVEDITFSEFTSRDVVRHRLVSKILDAYAEHEAAEERNRSQ